MRVPVEIIPESYSNDELEPADLDTPTEVISVHGKRSQRRTDDGEPRALDAAIYQLDAATIARLRQTAQDYYSKLSQEDRQETSVSALAMELAQQYVQLQRREALVSKSPAPVHHQDTVMSPQRSPFIRQATAAATVDPFASLQIEGLSTNVKPADISARLSWHSPERIDQVQQHLCSYHWVVLQSDNPHDADDISRVICIRDTRDPSEFQSPLLPFHDMLVADLRLNGGDQEMAFSVLSGIFKFQFGVFDFCMFLVARD